MEEDHASIEEEEENHNATDLKEAGLKDPEKEDRNATDLMEAIPKHHVVAVRIFWFM